MTITLTIDEDTSPLTYGSPNTLIEPGVVVAATGSLSIIPTIVWIPGISPCLCFLRSFARDQDEKLVSPTKFWRPL